MITRKMLSVYVRGDAVFIVPRAGLLSGGREVDPVTIVDLEREAVTDGIVRALERAPVEDATDSGASRKRTRKDPVVLAAGLKTRSAFESGAKLIDIRGLDEAVHVMAWVPNVKRGDGYDGIAWSIDLAADATALDVATLILEMLPQTPSRPPTTVQNCGEAKPIRTLLNEASAYIPEIISYDDLIGLVADGDERGIHRIVDILTEYIDEELPDTPQNPERDLLKRIMAVIELLLSDGSQPIRDAVAGQFICTTVAMRKDVRAAAGALTKKALMRQMTATNAPRKED